MDSKKDLSPGAPEPEASATPGAKLPYAPPKIEEFGSVLEMTRGMGMGVIDLSTTYSVMGV